MSLSQDRPTNPSKLFLRVKSGAVNYYDKESQQNVEVPTPFEFIVLDQLATVKGWSDADESGYWSNEVRSVGKDELSVRTSKGPRAKGLWREIKGDSAIAGAKYHSSIYIAHKFNDEMVISNLSLTGAALNSWIEFTQKNRINSNTVTLASWADAKKGSVSYKVPVFEASPMEESAREEAIELDKQLQAYLNEYFESTPSEGQESSRQDHKDVVVEDFDDEPIDLSEIPF